MTTVDTTGKLYYAPDMAGDPLKVEKGWSHFNAAGPGTRRQTIPCG